MGGRACTEDAENGYGDLGKGVSARDKEVGEERTLLEGEKFGISDRYRGSLARRGSKAGSPSELNSATAKDRGVSLE